MKHTAFKWLTGDVNWTDYGGMWIRQTGETTYDIVRFENWNDLCGEPGYDGSKYNVELATVDVAAHGGYTGPHGPNTVMSNRSTLENALVCIGLTLLADGSVQDGSGHVYDAAEPNTDIKLVYVEALHSFGAKDLCSSESGNNAYAMLRSVGVTRPNAHVSRARKAS